MFLNIGCGPFRAPEPWVNTDLIHVPGEIEPDICTVGPWPSELLMRGIDRESVTKLYLGHVLEHIRWDMIPNFMSELDNLLAPGCEVMVVGPDVFRHMDMVLDGDASVEDFHAAVI